VVVVAEEEGTREEDDAGREGLLLLSPRHIRRSVLGDSRVEG
jgi:hypothetical protein